MSILILGVFIAYLLLMTWSYVYVEKQYFRSVSMVATVSMVIVTMHHLKHYMNKLTVAHLEKYLDPEESVCSRLEKISSIQPEQHSNVYDADNLKKVILSTPDAMDAQGYDYEGIEGVPPPRIVEYSAI